MKNQNSFIHLALILWLVAPAMSFAEKTFPYPPDQIKVQFIEFQDLSPDARDFFRGLRLPTCEAGKPRVTVRISSGEARNVRKIETATHMCPESSTFNLFKQLKEGRLTYIEQVNIGKLPEPFFDPRELSRDQFFFDTLSAAQVRRRAKLGGVLEELNEVLERTAEVEKAYRAKIEDGFAAVAEIGKTVEFLEDLHCEDPEIICEDEAAE